MKNPAFRKRGGGSRKTDGLEGVAQNMGLGQFADLKEGLARKEGWRGGVFEGRRG